MHSIETAHGATPEITQITGDVTQPADSLPSVFQGLRFDIVVSCLASRMGQPRDAWAIDHLAHMKILKLAEFVAATQFILLLAICVQKLLLTFQNAELAFENSLIGSGIAYSIVRPTAFFKSLSGQVDRVRQSKPFLVFGGWESDLM